MEVIIVDTPDEVALRAADVVCRQLEEKPDSVLGLATGSTPVSLYQELIRRHQNGHLSFAQASSFNLDEYVGLAPDHPQSYRAFMQAKLFDHIDIDPARTHVPDGMASNPLDAGPSYEAAIEAAGGIDLQILGIGRDGHIAFNEPTSSLGSRTRIKTLTEETLTDNARFFGPDDFQPHLAITMGIASILDARHILLIATGDSKAEAIADTVEGPIAAVCPASALQWHRKTQVLLDSAAANGLSLRKYYKHVLREQDALLEKYRDRS